MDHTKQPPTPNATIRFDHDPHRIHPEPPSAEERMDAIEDALLADTDEERTEAMERVRTARDRRSDRRDRGR